MARSSSAAAWPSCGTARPLSTDRETPAERSRARSKVAMGELTKIGWTNHTFNPWLGCTNVSPGCDHCYAEEWAKRYGMVEWGNHPRRRTSPQTWRRPLLWDRRARESRQRARVFCASLADVFDNQAVPSW